MAELEELSEYVVVHPDDYARRWTLAKKLYTAWEYNSALKHLLFLKKNWTRKLNVLRYLAATYYRLGRYDEAIEELKGITQQWPSEAAVWEQLARVYEVSGKNADAANTWERVLQLQPNHPIASRSMQRLRSSSDDIRREDLRLRDSDSGIDMSPYRICRNCGAQNSEEFDRCWQCHTSLKTGYSETEAGPKTRPVRGTGWLFTLVGGISTVAILSADVYLTFIHARDVQNHLAFASVHDALSDSLLVPRLIAAGVLLFAWPLAFWFAFRLLRLRPVAWPRIGWTSLFLAALTYFAMWSPIRWLPIVAAAPVAASLAAVFALQPVTFVRGFAVWLVHGIVPLAAGIGAFIAAAGVRPLTEFPAILSYESSLSAVKTPLRFALFADAAPAACVVRWQTTGSTWLDECAGLTSLEFVPETPGDALTIEVKYGKNIVASANVAPYRIVLEVRAGADYEIWVRGSERASFHSFSNGVLQPFVLR